LPLAKSFDYAFSIESFITSKSKGGFQSLASKVTMGGHISAWVYGAENNEWITRWVNPVGKS
jgi:hypothetical protein